MSMKEEYTAIDMSTAAADGFRDGQSAAQSAPATVATGNMREVLAMVLQALDRDAAEGRGLRGEMAAELRAAMEAQSAGVPGTPGARWRANGEPDPHGDRYNCERAALAMGDLTDDELANGAFMNYDRPLNIEGILAGTHSSPIAWMTAVKDRIRWLSRKLDEALAAAPAQPAAQGKAHARCSNPAHDHLTREDFPCPTCAAAHDHAEQPAAQDRGEVQRMREALERIADDYIPASQEEASVALEEMRNELKLVLAEAALAASTGQEVKP